MSEHTKFLRITSYFSIETDLAGEMRLWPEFVSGHGYDVDLKDSASGERVTVRYVERDENGVVQIAGSGEGWLFDRVAGRVIHAMAAHSDHLMVDRSVTEPSTNVLT